MDRNGKEMDVKSEGRGSRVMSALRGRVTYKITNASNEKTCVYQFLGIQ